MRTGHALLFCCLIAGTAAAQDLNVVSSVELKDEGGAVLLTVRGSKQPNFTTFSMADPPRFVIDMSESRFQGVAETLTGDNGVVSLVKNLSYGSGTTSIARVMMAFTADVEPPDVQAVGNDLVVRVLRPGGAKPVAAAAPAAEAARQSAADARAAAEAKALAEQQAAARAQAEATRVAEAQAQAEAEAKVTAEAKAAAQAEAARLAEAKAAEQQAAAQASLAAGQDAAARAKSEAEAARQAKAEAAAAQVAAAKAEAEAKAEAKAMALAEYKAKLEAEKLSREQAKLDAAARAKADAEAAQAAAAEKKAKAEAELQAKAEAKKRAAEEAAAAKLAAAEGAKAAKLAAAEEAKAAKLAAEEAGAAAKRAAAEAKVASAGTAPGESLAQTAAHAAGGRPVHLPEVGFRQLPGASRVFVHVASLGHYTVTDVGDDVVRVVVDGAQASRRNNTRFLDTSFFNTPVALITPANRGSSYVVDIKLSHRVPYSKRVEGGVLAIDFERPAGQAEPAAEPQAAPVEPAAENPPKQ